MKAQTFSIALSVFVLGLSVVFAGTPTGGDYELVRSTIDGGGIIHRTGGGFELSGTLGQPEAGVMVGGDFTLNSGFWFEEPAGDCNATGYADLDDLALDVDCMSGPARAFGSSSCACFDFDADGDVDLFDLAALHESFVAD